MINLIKRLFRTKYYFILDEPIDEPVEEIKEEPKEIIKRTCSCGKELEFENEIICECGIKHTR